MHINLKHCVKIRMVEMHVLPRSNSHFIRQYICILACSGILFATRCHGTCGLVAGVMCNGGLCDRGSCICPPYLIGPDCRFTCPGPLSSSCNGRGTCVLSNDVVLQSALCTCVEKFRGPDCAIACPVFSGTVCSGRGLCSANGTCHCNSGFVGSDCSKECSGGSQMPCSGHGKCLPNATCSCYNGYFGESCSAHCVSNRGMICSGRGTLHYALIMEVT